MAEKIRVGREENVKVYLRFRPLNDDEVKEDTIEISEDKSTIHLNKSRYFKFNEIFPEGTDQKYIYETVAAPIVNDIFNGYNGTIFAYGQTGSGKTFTMFGDHSVLDLQGIVPNTFSHIFSLIAESEEFKSFAVTVSFLEIYNEELKDLLTPDQSKRITIHDKKPNGAVISGLSAISVNSAVEMKKLFLKGNKNRITKTNNINLKSSRSHAIFTINIETKNHKTDEKTLGKMHFVDLAGSERLERTKAAGDMLKEASHINLSLSVLGNVITSLIDKRATHVPYRNSKLTRFLQDSLGGNSKTTMIATLSPSTINFPETISTLRYAGRFKFVLNYISPVKEFRGIITPFENELRELREKLRHIEEKQQLKQIKQYKNSLKHSAKKRLQKELIKTEHEKDELLSRIDNIKEKIVVGGVNLLDKVGEQNDLLHKSISEIKLLRKNSAVLQTTLENRNKEKEALGKNFESLQEENADLDKRIAALEKRISEATVAFEEMRSEDEVKLKEVEEKNRALSEDLCLADLIIEKTIPSAFLKKIESEIHYDDENDTFSISRIEFAGNNVNSFGRNRDI